MTSNGTNYFMLALLCLLFIAVVGASRRPMAMVALRCRRNGCGDPLACLKRPVGFDSTERPAALLGSPGLALSRQTSLRTTDTILHTILAGQPGKG